MFRRMIDRMNSAMNGFYSYLFWSPVGLNACLSITCSGHKIVALLASGAFCAVSSSVRLCVSVHVEIRLHYDSILFLFRSLCCCLLCDDCLRDNFVCENTGVKSRSELNYAPEFWGKVNLNSYGKRQNLPTDRYSCCVCM